MECYCCKVLESCVQGQVDFKELSLKISSFTMSSWQWWLKFSIR